MKKQTKKNPLIKFLGTITLLMTMGGVLSALAGQLDLFGKTKEENSLPASVEGGKKNAPKNPIIMVKSPDEKKIAPKYDFYDLLKHQTQLNKGGQSALKMAVENANIKSDKLKKQTKVKDLSKIKRPSTIKTKMKLDESIKAVDKREGYNYMVQIGGFSRKKDANRLKTKAEKLGYPVVVVKPHSKFLVQTGPFHGMKNALAAKKYLRKNKFDTMIARLKE